MTIGTAFGAYSRLTTRQRRLLHQKQVVARYLPGQWWSLFKGLTEFDRYGDNLRKTVGRIALGCLLGAFVGLFLGLILMDAAGLPQGMVWALETLLIAASVVFSVLYYVLKGKDLPNNLRLFVAPLVRVLGEDIKPNTPLYMRLDLSGGTQKRKQTGEDKQDPGRFRYPKVVDTYYVDPWFQGSARLTDGSSLKWRVVDHIRERRVAKKNYRGKVKVKYKHKIKRDVKVLVGLRQDTYRPARAQVPGQVRFDVSTRNNRVLLRFTRSFVDRQSSYTPGYAYLDWPLELDDFLDLIALGFRGVEPQRA